MEGRLGAFRQPQAYVLHGWVVVLSSTESDTQRETQSPHPSLQVRSLRSRPSRLTQAGTGGPVDPSPFASPTEGDQDHRARTSHSDPGSSSRPGAAGSFASRSPALVQSHSDVRLHPSGGGAARDSTQPTCPRGPRASGSRGDSILWGSLARVSSRNPCSATLPPPGGRQ